MKKRYIVPVTVSCQVKTACHLLAGSGGYNTDATWGLSSDDYYNYHKGAAFFGNDSWVNQGYRPGSPSMPGGEGVVGVPEDNSGLNSRSKGSLWDDDDY